MFWLQRDFFLQTSPRNLDSRPLQSFGGSENIGMLEKLLGVKRIALVREKTLKKGKNPEIRGVLEKGPYLAYIEISLSEILI
jgi:hypothetical protein